MNGTSAQAQARLAYLCDEIQRLARRHSSLRIIAMDSLTDLLARMEQQTSSAHTSVPSSARGQQNQTTPSKTASSRKKQFFEPSPEGPFQSASGTSASPELNATQAPGYKTKKENEEFYNAVMSGKPKRQCQADEQPISDDSANFKVPAMPDKRMPLDSTEFDQDLQLNRSEPSVEVVSARANAALREMAPSAPGQRVAESPRHFVSPITFSSIVFGDEEQMIPPAQRPSGRSSNNPSLTPASAASVPDSSPMYARFRKDASDPEVQRKMEQQNFLRAQLEAQVEEKRRLKQQQARDEDYPTRNRKW